MVHYADIDANGVCKSISGYEKRKDESPSQIRLDSYDISVIGKRWNGTEWEEYEPKPIDQPTEQEITQAKLDYLLMMQE